MYLCHVDNAMKNTFINQSNTMNTLLQRRNRDFMSAFKQALSRLMKHGEPTVEQVILELLDGEAPAYYVSYDYAYAMVCAVIKGQLRVTTSLRNRMWFDLAGEVRRIMREASYPISIADALIVALETCPAPSFYLTFNSARRLYYHLLEQKRRLAQPKLF